MAQQMEAYRDRIARRIREEAAKRGESAPDLAHALRAYPQTVERWFRGERIPQHRYRVAMADHWEIPFEDLEPDLAAPEREVREQLDRIEAMLRQLLQEQGLEPIAKVEDDPLIEAAAEAFQAIHRDPKKTSQIALKRRGGGQLRRPVARRVGKIAQGKTFLPLGLIRREILVRPQTGPLSFSPVRCCRHGFSRLHRASPVRKSGSPGRMAQ